MPILTRCDWPGFQAFTLMDQNRDGFIDKEDLKDTYASLGRCHETELRHSPLRAVLQSWRDLLCTWALLT